MTDDPETKPLLIPYPTDAEADWFTQKMIYQFQELTCTWRLALNRNNPTSFSWITAIQENNFEELPPDFRFPLIDE